MNYINMENTIKFYNKCDMLEKGIYTGPDLSGQCKYEDDYYGDRVLDNIMDSYNDYVSSYQY